MAVTFQESRVRTALPENPDSTPSVPAADEHDRNPLARRNLYAILLAGNVLLWALILGVVAYLRS